MSVLFWLVWREGGGVPTYKHVTLSNAMREAERLAKSLPGDTFYVMELKCSVIKQEVQWQYPDYVDADEIPY